MKERQPTGTLIAGVLVALVAFALCGAALLIFVRGPAEGGQGAPSVASPSGVDTPRPSAGPSLNPATSNTPSQEPTSSGTPIPTPSPGGSVPEITLTADPSSARPFETVRLSGRYLGTMVSGVELRVQRRDRGQWLDYPLPAMTDQSGNFVTHVELGSPGRHRLRVVAAAGLVVSDTLTVVVR